MTAHHCLALPVLLLLAAPAAARTAPQEDPSKRLEAVFNKLVSLMDPVPGMEWPPRHTIVSQIGKSAYNACAYAEIDNGKVYPTIAITRNYLVEVVPEDNALALTLGHELGHVYHRHILEHRGLQTLTARNAFRRSQEYEADLFGARLALRAGYSLRKGIAAKWRSFERIRGLYPSLAALEADHPAWSDRFARLAALLDNEQLVLWRSMSSYDNGVMFLQLQQYQAAEMCFTRVVREFPKCHEAWVNLGVARLMQYCEALSADQLRDLGVGQVLGATFYHQAQSLVPRGNNEELWQNAVKALRTALDLRRDQPLVQANLGLAYLLHPGGKEVGLGEAERYLHEAVEKTGSAKELDYDTRIALLVNLGVARLAGGARSEGLRLLEQAVTLEPNLRRGVVGYNRAMVLASGASRAEQTEAAGLFEDYLRTNDPALTWWKVAFARYQTLCERLDRPARPRGELRPARTARPRPCLTVTLSSGATVALTDPVEALLGRLGKPARERKEPGSSFRRLKFPAHGIELLVDEQEVIAILLTGPAAPAITVRGKEWGSGVRAALRVGMPRKEVEAMPGGTGYVHRPLTQFGRCYHYYRSLCLAVHYDRPGPDGVVQELVLIVIPEGDV